MTNQPTKQGPAPVPITPTMSYQHWLKDRKPRYERRQRATKQLGKDYQIFLIVLELSSYENQINISNSLSSRCFFLYISQAFQAQLVQKWLWWLITKLILLDPFTKPFRSYSLVSRYPTPNLAHLAIINPFHISPFQYNHKALKCLPWCWLIMSLGGGEEDYWLFSKGLGIVCPLRKVHVLGVWPPLQY